MLLKESLIFAYARLAKLLQHGLIVDLAKKYLVSVL